MIFSSPSPSRDLKTETLAVDLCVAGGGLAGTCCAITAARQGLRVALIQDRPVLGGNSSSEVRLWVLGATSHMYSNNRWAREGGLIDEILVENMHRNPEGNALIFDTILLEKVISEPGITLLLNTAVHSVKKSAGDPDLIESVEGFCSQNSTRYQVSAPLFCDATGDGIVGFLAGAAFRMGAESREEFGEGFAPDRSFGELLGHSLYFYSKDTGHPVEFVPPAFALADIEGAIPRYRDFKARESGCRLWWIEYGGRLDTVHETEKIKWELWRVVYGVWNYIKNSGKFPEAANLTLEWVGHIPGKRESRRFEGDYILRQQDIIEQKEHQDAVAFGGWALDLHPADGIYSPGPGYTHEHARGLYQIPYRCLYSRNVKNLFLGGRIMSCSHVAFGSTRVMATLAHCAQAIAHAAALCIRHHLLPRDAGAEPMLKTLQLHLLRSGQHIPLMALQDPEDLTHAADLNASSEFLLHELPPDGPWLSLQNSSRGQLIPVLPGPFPKIKIRVKSEAPFTLHAELRQSHHPEYHTPDVILSTKTIEVPAGNNQEVTIDFEASIDTPRYVFVCFLGGVPAAIQSSTLRVSGLLSVENPFAGPNQEHPHLRYQKDRPELGIIGFEKWCPQRRPEGQLLAIRFEAPLKPFAVDNVRNGVQRPTSQSNAWVADPADPLPTLTLQWQKPQSIRRLELFFDTDHDHPMESVLLGHPERHMPSCVKKYRLLANGALLSETCDNFQTRNTLTFQKPIETQNLTLQLLETWGHAPAALFEIRCYADP